MTLSTQSSIAKVLGGPRPLLTSVGPKHTCSAQIYLRQNTHTQKTNRIINFKLLVVNHAETLKEVLISNTHGRGLYTYLKPNRVLFDHVTSSKIQTPQITNVNHFHAIYSGSIKPVWSLCRGQTPPFPGPAINTMPRSVGHAPWQLLLASSRDSSEGFPLNHFQKSLL